MKFYVVESLKNKNDDTLTLYYPRIKVTVYGDKLSGDWYNPDEYEEYNKVVDYEYEVPVEDVVDYMYVDVISDDDVPSWFEMSDDDARNWVRDNIDILFDKYKDKVAEHFRDDAEEAAQEEYSSYDVDDYID